MIDTPLIIRFFLLILGGIVGIALTGWSLWRLFVTFRDRLAKGTPIRGSMLFFYFLILLIGTADLGKVSRDLVKLLGELNNSEKRSSPEPSYEEL